MQGIVFDIKRFAVHDGPGIRTTVFFKGCPLKCRWCHNPESIDIHPGHFVKKIKLDGFEFDKSETIGISASVSELVELIKKDFIFMEESGGGVTFSGGEPTLQPEFLISLLKACKEEGIHTAVDTCGYVSRRTLKQILPFVDLFLFDLKQLDSEKHLEGTGQHNDVIIDNLIFLIDSGIPIHLRIPVIPGFNYSEYDMVMIIKFLKNFKGRVDQVDLLPYHTIAKNKYKRFGIINKMDDTPGLKKEDLFNFAELFRKEGFNVKIGG